MQNSPDQRGFAMIDVAHEDDTEGSGNRGAETGERIVFRIHRSLVIRAVLIEETVTARISFASCSNSFVRFSATNPSSRITYCLQRKSQLGSVGARSSAQAVYSAAIQPIEYS